MVGTAVGRTALRQQGAAGSSTESTVRGYREGRNDGAPHSRTAVGGTGGGDDGDAKVSAKYLAGLRRRQDLLRHAWTTRADRSTSPGEAQWCGVTTGTIGRESASATGRNTGGCPFARHVGIAALNTAVLHGSTAPHFIDGRTVPKPPQADK